MVSLGLGFSMLVIFDWFPGVSGCLYSGLVFCLVWLVLLVLVFDSWFLGGHFRNWNTFFSALLWEGGESLEFSGFCDGFCPISKVLLVNSGDFPPFFGGGSLLGVIF